MARRCDPQWEEESSIDETIKNRKYKVMNSIRESISIIEDTRMNKLGGVQCALDIWDKLLLVISS